MSSISVRAASLHESAARLEELAGRMAELRGGLAACLEGLAGEAGNVVSEAVHAAHHESSTTAGGLVADKNALADAIRRSAGAYVVGDDGVGRGFGDPPAVAR